MNCSNHRLAAMFAASCLAGAVFAQQDESASAVRSLPGDPVLQPAPRAAIHTQEPDGGTSYGVWGGGARYKASFHDGATFVPYLGRDYPRNQSFTWRTLSASVGALELADGAPTLSYGDYRAEYDLGGVVEAYDVLDNGLEQTFVIARRPAGHGDLVIRGAVTTDLVAPASPAAHRAITFFDANGDEILSYGAATAVDAGGRRMPMTSTFEGGVITLRLAASWLEAASYPLVVDPLLGVIYAVSGDAIGATDTVRDTFGVAGNIWRVATRWVSATDTDLFASRFDDDGSNPVYTFIDQTSSWSTLDPSLGVHRNADCVLLVFARQFASGTRKLRFHKHLRSDFTQQSAYGSVSTGSSQAWRPDVAQDINPFGVESLLVVFQQENGATFYETPTSEVWGVAIDLTSINGVAGAPFVIGDGTFEDYERPQVGSVRVGGAQVWTVAYQVIGNNPMFSTHDDWDIELCRADRSGNVGPATTIGRGNANHDMAPRLAGFNDAQLLAYTRAMTSVVGPRPTEPFGTSLLAERRNWNGFAFIRSQPLGFVESAGTPRIELGGVDIDHGTMSHYALVYRSTATENVYIAALGYRGHLLRSETVHAAGAGETTVVGGIAFDDDGGTFVVPYGSNVAGVGMSFMRFDRYAHPSQAGPVNSGLGCSSAQISWSGTVLIGDENCSIDLTNLDPGALATVIVGTQPYQTLLTGVPLVHPGCWLLVPNTGPGSLVTMPVAFGPSVSYRLALPEFLPNGFTLYCQGVHFDGGFNEVFTTDRLEVTLVK
ncbi:MAG: hypothetical protein KDE27_23950 [Planctomycetes bacterium]|nr:hypothetical protein [Planctomycetota bacterium]